MYKKLLALMLALCMSMVFMAGCSSGNDSQSPKPGSDEAKQQAQEQNENL